MPEGADGLYLQEGLVEASLQYGLPKASPDLNGEVLLSQPWNHDIHTEAERPPAGLSAMDQYGAIPVAPGFDPFESVLTDFETYRMPREQGVSTSPSQYSSVTGSLSTIAAMESSRRSSVVYSSQSAGSNPLEQAQSDATTHTTPMAQPEPDLAQTPPRAPTIPSKSQRLRSRGAAIKCREKTKAAMAQLEATERAASLEHMELSKTVADLREEVLALKNQLLLHGNCNCDVIQQYLRNAARSIGEGSSVNYASSQGRIAAWTNPPGFGRHHSFS
ncbi:hypothetical protein N0V82_007297 [Gnomoniopsis sp. IMI 355080]|nr:hypothetical protein N0V82_007297 [Gnomoniopsis sp. IMI 355080]